jgi:hypothetical protein
MYDKLWYEQGRLGTGGPFRWWRGNKRMIVAKYDSTLLGGILVIVLAIGPNVHGF